MSEPELLKVFISYSHKDRLACEELQRHLTPLEDNQSIKVWVDERTLAGEEWEGPISDNLNAAKIIILLLSPNFANSRYCKNIGGYSILRGLALRDPCWQ